MEEFKTEKNTRAKTRLARKQKKEEDDVRECSPNKSEPDDNPKPTQDAETEQSGSNTNLQYKQLTLCSCCTYAKFSIFLEDKKKKPGRPKGSSNKRARTANVKVDVFADSMKQLGDMMVSQIGDLKSEFKKEIADVRKINEPEKRKQKGT